MKARQRGLRGALVVAGCVVEALVLSPLLWVPPSRVPTGVVGAIGILIPVAVAVLVGAGDGLVVALFASAALLIVTPDGGAVGLLPAALWPAIAIVVGVLAERRRLAIAAAAEAAARQDQHRIAAELHDDALQMLAAALVMFESMRARLIFPGDPRYTATIELLRDALDRTRLLIFDLRDQTELGTHGEVDLVGDRDTDGG